MLRTSYIFALTTQHTFSTPMIADVHLVVHKMQYAVASFKDLNWIIPDLFRNFKDGDLLAAAHLRVVTKA